MAFSIEFNRANWDRGKFRDDVHELVAKACGWVVRKENRYVWWDAERGEPSGYDKRGGVGWHFQPSNDTGHALDAARIFAARRKVRFSLNYDVDDGWHASFPLSSQDGPASGWSAVLEEAVCEAIVKAGKTIDPNELFRS